MFLLIDFDQLAKTRPSTESTGSPRLEHRLALAVLAVKDGRPPSAVALKSLGDAAVRGKAIPPEHPWHKVQMESLVV